MSMTRRVAAFALILLAARIALAQPACPQCDSAFSKQPDIQQWLAANGFPASEYDVRFAWTEPSRDGLPVFGYRIQSRAGGTPFDLYSDSEGALLDAAALAPAGVTPKTWDAVDVEVSSEPALGAAESAAPAPKSLGLKAKRAAVKLPTLDKQALLAQDELAGPEKGAIRTGVFQVFPEPITVTESHASAGQWQTVANGERVWSLTITSSGAVGQRIHITRLGLPAGAYLLVYNAADPKERYGPFVRMPEGDSDFCTPTSFGESVTLEVVAPEHGEVDFEVDRIVHVYRGLDSLPWGVAKTPAGACNLDLACYADWLDTANGVGGIGLVGSAGSLFCTGTLVVDANPATQVPYFLTANHCVPGAGNPNSVEVYWFYQRTSCGGTTPGVLTVPRTTGGADLLATSAANRPSWTGTDFTLLRLRNAPPAGATYVGWTAKAQVAGQPTTCIHHPRGDYKRITFGFHTADTDPCFVGVAPPASKYYQSSWTAGTTEGGSSGSPLLGYDNQRIMGQLWGGYASCASPTCPDYYGRFDVSYPLMAAYLNPGAASRVAQLGSTTIIMDEGDGDAVLTVTLSAAPAGDELVSVFVDIEGGAAAAGTDYAAEDAVLVFDELRTTASIVIPVVEEGEIEGDESFTVTLTSPVGCTLGTPTTATIKILDNDTDTDGDRLSEYDENNGSYGFVTNPAEPDTDGDGVDDYVEIGVGTDPTDPGDVPSIPSLSAPFFRAEPQAHPDTTRGRP